MERLAYKPSEVVELLGSSRSSLYREMASGRLPSFTIGRSRYIRRDDLMAWLDRNREGHDEVRNNRPLVASTGAT